MITLAALTDLDLRELGVASLGHRKRLLAAIEGLARAAQPSAAPTLPTFLAQPLHEYQTSADPVLKLWHASDLLELSLRFMVIVGWGCAPRSSEVLALAVLRDERLVATSCTAGWITLVDATSGVVLRAWPRASCRRGRRRSSRWTTRRTRWSGGATGRCGGSSSSVRQRGASPTTARPATDSLRPP